MADSPVIIDVRTHAAYHEGHTKGAFSFPWPIPKAHFCRLPPRDRAVLVVGEPDMEMEVRTVFDTLGYERITFTAVSDMENPNFTREVPSGVSWSPNPFLAERVASIEAAVGGPGVAVDAGSGTGRDMVYLALRGWFVMGLENRAKLIKDGNDFSTFHSTSSQTSNLLVDVGHGIPIRPESVDLVSVCRFIHRPSFPALVSLLKPGGLLLYSHFLEGCEKTALGRPKDAKGFFLHGELERMVIEQNCEVVSVHQALLADTRPMVHLIARKSQ